MAEAIDAQAILRVLVNTWNEGTGELTMGQREHVLVGLTAYGMTAQVYALSDAVLLLDEHDHHLAVVPLVRQAIECATTAMWVERSGYPATLALLREQSRQVRNSINEFVKAGMPRDEAALASISEELARSLRTTTQAHEKFQARCGELTNGTLLYAMYRAASEVSHAGVGIVDRYIVEADVTDVSPLGVGLVARPGDENNDSWMGALLAMVVHATSAWSRIDKNHAARTRMKDLARMMGIDYTPKLSAAGLRVQRVRQAEFRAWAAEQSGGVHADPFTGQPPVSA